MVRTDAAISSPFRPGMSATVEIETETAVNIKTIAIQAVTTRADTSGRVKTAKEKREEERLSSEKGVAKSNDKIEEYVFLLEDGKAKLIKVKTGIQDNKYIEVTEGLKDGDEVIVAPYRSVSKTLKNNDDVEKVKKEELFKSDKDN